MPKLEIEVECKCLLRELVRQVSKDVTGESMQDGEKIGCVEMCKLANSFFTAALCVYTVIK